MLTPLRSFLLWLALCLSGATWLTIDALRQIREDFDVQGRIAHRLMSQRAAQHEALLAALSLLPLETARSPALLARLRPSYPQIVALRPVDNVAPWQTPLMASRQLQRAVWMADDATHFWLVRATPTATEGVALRVDLTRMLPASERPGPGADLLLTLPDGRVVWLGRAPVHPVSTPIRLGFEKVLGSDSQAFRFQGARQVLLRELPWLALLLWAAISGAAVAGLRLVLQQRLARRRAEHLLRLGQASRLNTLGEMAAGLAHELNQPLTAILSHAQGVRRLAEDEATPRERLSSALDQIIAQARRAGDIVQRLRGYIGTASQPSEPVDVMAALKETLFLLEPMLKERGILVQMDNIAAHQPVLADPVAVQQILHNLLSNAADALMEVPPERRRITVTFELDQSRLRLRIRDRGPGLPSDPQQLFEPFYSTKQGGMGLGLPLSESLAIAQGGSLSATPEHDGALFELTLPRAGNRNRT